MQAGLAITQNNTDTMSFHLSLAAFVVLFAFRYVRVILNIIYNFKYKALPIPVNPSYQDRDVTVLICTTQLMTSTFIDVVQSILAHDIHSLIISTAGYKAPEEEAAFKQRFPDPRLRIH